MVAFRENPRIDVAGPTRYNVELRLQAEINSGVQGNWGFWNDSWHCAVDAAYTIANIARDLYVELYNWAHPTPSQAAPADIADAKDLIRLLYWARYNVLSPACVGRDYVLRESRLPLQRIDNDFANDLHDIVTYAERSQALIYNVPVDQLHTIVEYHTLMGNINGWAVQHPQNMTTQLSALGFMELLLRVHAQAANSQAQLINRTANLYSRKPNRFKARALPSAAFVCGGHNNGNSIVVTTSRDFWLGMYPVYPMANRARDMRVTAPPVLLAGQHAPAFDVPGVSNGVYNHYVAHENDVANVTSDRAAAIIRQAAIDSWRANGATHVAAHAGEACMPLNVPEFTVKARCLRCQAIFAYDAADAGLRAAEEDLRGDRRTHLSELCFDQWFCAETIAHFYCAAAIIAGNH